MTTHIYLPSEWVDLQSRLVRYHPEIWRAIQSMDKNDAIVYLNTLLGVQVASDALLKDAATTFLNALLRKEGVIYLADGRLSK